MATQKKKPLKTLVKTTKKKPVPVMKKAKKKVSQKKTAPKNPSQFVKPVVVVRRSWFSFFRTTAMILILAAGAVVVSVDPSVIQNIRATLMAQLDTTEAPAAEVAAEKSGILLSFEKGGVNEQKLLDIFRTVFPETSIEEVAFDSEKGKQLVEELGVTEVPNIYFEKTAFEAERLSEVVKDLFSVQGDYYGLNVALVNPSYQVRIKGPLTTEGGVWVGEKEAPITVYVYSDVKCQHCRVNERNNTSEWMKLVDEGLVQLVYLDLPQNVESTFHSTVLSCYYDLKKDTAGYLDLREKLFARANLTKAYAIRELQRAGVAFEKQCDEAAYRSSFRNRLKTADEEGVTGVPTVYISQAEENRFIRFTGAKDFTEYQAILDKLLGQTAAAETAEQ